MSWESVWNVLKWVLAALAAGFVGQFGRSYAVHLLARRRQRKAEDTAAHLESGVPPVVQLEQTRLETEAKTEKKRAKAELKRLKKSHVSAEAEKEDDKPS